MSNWFHYTSLTHNILHQELTWEGDPSERANHSTGGVVNRCKTSHQVQRFRDYKSGNQGNRFTATGWEVSKNPKKSKKEKENCPSGHFVVTWRHEEQWIQRSQICKS